MTDTTAEQIAGLNVSNAFLDPSTIRIRRTERGMLLVHIGTDAHDDVSVRRAFPLQAADKLIGLFDSDGEELGILEVPQQLDADSRAALDEQLSITYFLPKITTVVNVTEDFGVVQADVVTTSGDRQIEIRGIRSSIRVLSRHRALIEDAEGNRYELSDYRTLPKIMREILGL